MPIPATGGDARVQAGVGIALIAIVAGLALRDDAVAASWRLTKAGAGIVFVLVAIIADLNTLVDNAIAATGCPTVIKASIALFFVAIVTSLSPLIIGSKVGASDPITADGNATCIGTGIVGVGVVVIAGFKPVFTRLKVSA